MAISTMAIEAEAEVSTAMEASTMATEAEAEVSTTEVSTTVTEAEVGASVTMEVSTMATGVEVAIREVQAIHKSKGFIWLTRSQKPMQMFLCR